MNGLLLATCALGLLAAPLTVEAQPGKVPRIGFLAPGPAPVNVAALREGLRELGYVEPTNLILEVRWGDGRLDRLPGLAADLVRFGIDVIVTDSTAAALAAKGATTTIPIVMGTGGSDPVGRGLAASIARPSGNVTGLILPTLNGKHLELLKEAVGPEPLRQGLRRLGWVEGQDFAIEYRFTEGKPERLPDLAAELVRLKVDLIFVTSTPAARAAQRATESIPVVFTGVADPIGVRLVASLARPGGNLTGFTTSNVELSAKRLELLTLAVPNLRRVAVFVNPASPQAPSLRKETETAAASLGLTLQIVGVESATDLPKAFASIAPPVGALLVLPDPLIGSRETQARIAELALKSRIPTMERTRSFAELGGLMSYGVNLADLVRESARHVDRILRGVRPADLPVEQPTKFELVINLRTARALGLTIPESVILRANELIQ